MHGQHLTSAGSSQPVLFLYIQLKWGLVTVGHLANISYIATSVPGAQICARETYRHVS